MNKFNLLLKRLFFIATVPLIMAGCNKDLQDDVNDLKDRVSTLEDSVDKLEEAIASGKLITAVTAFAATDTTPGGYNIVFSDNSTIAVYNGPQGNKGDQGDKGQQGDKGDPGNNGPQGDKGDQGDQGDKGDQGIQGPKGDSPYIWINSAGNWAINLNSKPADSDNAAYELKVGGQSVKAYGTSTRTIEKDGFVAFEEYDAVSGVVKNTVVTTIPYDHRNYITSIIETDESVTLTIDSKAYTLAKAAVYPQSITIIRDKDWVIKGGTAEFNIAVSPSTSKVYAKEAFELDFEKNYAATRGVAPDFITIKDVQPVVSTKGQYTVTLEWAESQTAFAKDAAIFVVLNFTDGKGNPAKVMSASPVIMNEKYVSIEEENVLSANDIVLFSDETFTDSVRLSNYHEGYVNTVGFTITPRNEDATRNAEPKAVNDPFTRYISADNKYKFTVVPIPGSNSTVWPAGVYSRVVDVKASVIDHGRAAVPATPARPDLGIPEQPGIPAIDPVTIDKDFTITVYKVPTDGVIYRHDFKEWWIPNKTVDYKPSVELAAEFEKSGYFLADWDFAIKSQTLKKGSAAIAMTDNITADASKFDAANNFAVSYKLLPTINAGKYTVELVVTATPKQPRPAGASQQGREFKVVMSFKIVAPAFMILIREGHNVIGNGENTYYTYKLSDVKIADLIDIESTQNISKETDLTPNTAPLGYEFDLTEPRQGAQGVRFTPYPAVTAPAVAEWMSALYIKRPVSVIVRLDTKQEIPVEIFCTETNSSHATKTIYVQYERLNLHHVSAGADAFAGNYNTMISTGISIAAGSNFSPESSEDETLDPTMIKQQPEGIVFSEVGTVQCQGGTLPSGLAGKKILAINTSTGLVKSIDGMTWENPEAVLYQIFRVTYTDIWGNSASKDVKVFVKSNGVPSI